MTSTIPSTLDWREFWRVHGTSCRSLFELHCAIVNRLQRLWPRTVSRKEAPRGCDCNAPAIEKAAKALAKHPEKSDRAIAQDIGVSDKTVAKARRSTADDSAVEGKRIGRDGKTYPASKVSVSKAEAIKSEAELKLSDAKLQATSSLWVSS